MSDDYKLKRELDEITEQLETIAINDEELSVFERSYQEAKHNNLVNRFGRVCYEKAITNDK